MTKKIFFGIIVLITLMIIQPILAYLPSICGSTIINSSIEGTEFSAISCENPPNNYINIISERTSPLTQDNKRWDIGSYVYNYNVYANLFLSAHWGDLQDWIGHTQDEMVPYWHGLTPFQTLDKVDSIAFTSICNSSITISLERENAQCHCTIFEPSTLYSTDLQDGGQYSIFAGQTYSLITVLESLDDPNMTGKCTCSLQGPIAMNNGKWNMSVKYLNTESPIQTNGAENLVCCKTEEGFCLENYLEGECNGTSYCSSCDEITGCLF